MAVRTLVRASQEPRVLLGRIVGLYGVQGWFRVRSYTEPRENILAYSPWQLHLPDQRWETRVVEGQRRGDGILARLDLCGDRDTGRRFLGATIAILRSQLPALEEGEYYWTDLLGLEVFNQEGLSLGKIADLMETGANDVLVVKGNRERLIPFLTNQVVLEVNLRLGWIRVDWDAEF